MGQCASIHLLGYHVKPVNPHSFQPRPGCMLFFNLSLSSNPGSHYLVKESTWFNFTSCGFLVEGKAGYDAILISQPARCSNASSPSAQPERRSSRDAEDTVVCRVPYVDLITSDEVKELAVANLSPVLQAHEVALIEQFATEAVGHGGMSKRVTLLSSRGRKVFVAQLIGEMLCAAGRLVRSHSDMYGPKTCWTLPDLTWLAVPMYENSQHPQRTKAQHKAQQRASNGPPSGQALLALSKQQAGVAESAKQLAHNSLDKSGSWQLTARGSSAVDAAAELTGHNRRKRRVQQQAAHGERCSLENSKAEQQKCDSVQDIHTCSRNASSSRDSNTGSGSGIYSDYNNSGNSMLSSSVPGSSALSTATTMSATMCASPAANNSKLTKYSSNGYNDLGSDAGSAVWLQGPAQSSP